MSSLKLLILNARSYHDTHSLKEISIEIQQKRIWHLKTIDNNIYNYRISAME